MKRVAWKSITAPALWLLVLTLVAPGVVAWAWNLALPGLFGLPPLDYRGALGLMLLGLTASMLLHSGGLPRRHSPRRSRDAHP